MHEIKINQQLSEGSSFIVVSKGNKEIEQGIDEKTRITFNLGFDSSYDLSQILFYLVIYIYTKRDILYIFLPYSFNYWFVLYSIRYYSQAHTHWAHSCITKELSMSYTNWSRGDVKVIYAILKLFRESKHSGLLML